MAAEGLVVATGIGQMTVNIFKFWSQVGPTDNIHPADKEVIGRVRHGFDLLTLPACFSGPLRTAPIVLLYLSPGLNKRRDRKEARSKIGQNHYVLRRAGREPLPGREFCGWGWWVSRTKCFEENWEKLRSKIAILNIGAYHSKTFADAPLLAALPSSRVSIGWAQDVLFPEARKGKRLVICLRSARFWGLRESTNPFGQALFAPPVTRGGYMKKGKVRDQIVRMAKGFLKKSN